VKLWTGPPCPRRPGRPPDEGERPTGATGRAELEIYRPSRNFPAQERFGLTTQLRSAKDMPTSVPASRDPTRSPASSVGVGATDEQLTTEPLSRIPTG
jgi:hypothetical protein